MLIDCIILLNAMLEFLDRMGVYVEYEVAEVEAGFISESFIRTQKLDSPVQCSTNHRKPKDYSAPCASLTSIRKEEEGGGGRGRRRTRTRRRKRI